ncbi:MAG: cache domain-containing protein [Bacteroidetes bacterium]|nr:cache domain-containing protein [Bacteroidota bacterium]
MKIKKLSDWNVFPKLIAMAVLILLSFFTYVVLGLFPSLETKLYSDKKEALQHTVETSTSIIQYYVKKAKAGELSTGEAKNLVKEEIAALRYDNDNYYWINDLDVNMVMHPIKPELNGTSVESNKDPNGVQIFAEMVKVAKSSGTGYVEYMWPKVGKNEPVAKIAYVELIKDWGWVIGTGIYVDDVEEEISNFQSSIMVFLFIIAILGLVIGFVIAREISSKIKKLAEGSEKVAGGDVNVSVDINNDNELGKLAKSFNIMVENIRNSVEEIKQKGEVAERAAADAEEAQAVAQEQQEYLAESTRTILAEMESFANGDLRVRVTPPNEDDDIGKLFNGFNRAIANINDMMSRVAEAVDATASASNEISASSEQMAAGAQEQSAQTAEVAAAVEQMAQTIIQTSQNASNSANSADTTSAQAKEGVKKLNENKAGIERITNSAQKTGTIIASLANKTDQIGEIAQVIDDIADQTNLLALNAAIEAARAGEQGRGFAVVADEVRKLAERTTKATSEIAETIKSIQNEAREANESMLEASESVKDAVRLTNETEKVFQSILESTNALSAEISQVAAASEEQSAGAEQISKNVEGINSVSQQNASSVQLVAQAAEDLNMLTNNLHNLIGNFKIAADNLSNSNLAAKHENRAKGRYLSN